MDDKAKKAKGLSKEEIAAMKDYLKEKNTKSEGESVVLAAIAKMPEPDRSMAKKLHAIIKAAAPGLIPRTWYGMPAYSKGEDVVVFFQPASKFKVRYMTLGFSDSANLDEGSMWPVTYALPKLTATDEAKITALVKKAVG
ncbi:MAG: iron chaperone [Candidatus Micrarchaeales archaeon]